MTYREAIQIQIAALHEVYDNCNGIRDAATDNEKDAWNKVRGALPSVWAHLQALDNLISDKRGAAQLHGTYNVKQDTTTI